MDLLALRDHLLRSYYVVKLGPSEREFLAELIEKYAEQKLSRKEIAAQKANAVAHYVFCLEEFHGLKFDSAVAYAQKQFGLGRTRITDILRQERPKWESVRTQVRSEAGRKTNALIQEYRTHFAKEDLAPSPRRQTHLEWLEQLAEELPALMKAQKEVDDELIRINQLESAE